MTSQQTEEINYWKGFHERNINNYTEARKVDYAIRCAHLPGLEDEVGIGLDYGSALISIFEESGKKFDAIDPLMDSYKQILELPTNYYVDTNRKYDWIACFNVIDHEETPEKIVADLRGKLKKDGKIYFQVNFDDQLSPAHYSIFNEDMVNSLFKGFRQTYKEIYRGETENNYGQSHFYAIYTL